MDDKSFTIRVPKRWARVAMIVGVIALIVAPLTAVASHVFNDVPASHTFHNDITWLADAEVTRGCNPPDNTEFCPDDNVTRGQMAAFMNRFAGYIDAEDGTPGLADHAATANSAATADDADTLDGNDAADFVEHGEIVTTVGGGNWIANGFIVPSDVTHAAGTTRVAEGTVELELQGPAMLGGVSYGLQSLTYCIHAVNGGSFVTLVEIYRGSSNVISPLVEDETNRTVAGCYDVDVGHSGDTYSVAVEVSGSNLRVGGVEAHWLPAAQLTSSSSLGSEDPGAAAGG